MLKRKIGYACGDIYGGGSFLIFGMLYMNFLVIVEGLPVVLATIIVFAGKLWDAITDPILGSMSDRTRSRFGRRRPYFLIGSIPVFLSFIMLWYSFGIDSVTGRFIYHLFAYLFFGTAFTVVMVPYNAILPEMTSDYNERTGFTTVRMAFSAGTAILAAILPAMLIKTAGAAENGPAQKYGYLLMAAVFGLLFGLCWIFTFLGTRERGNAPPVESFSLKRWLGIFKNKTYRAYLGIFISVQVAIDLLLALFVFYIDITLLRYRSYELIMGVLMVFQLLFMFVNGVLAKKKGKVFPLYIALPLWIVSLASFLFVGPSTPLYVVCILAAFIAYGSSAGNLATWSMLSDVCDVDELMTGMRREGIYSGLTTFMRKFSSGFAILILGFALQAAGFNQNEYSLQKSSAASFDPALYAAGNTAEIIKWLFVLVPLLLLLVTLFFSLRYKLDRNRYERVHAGIQKFRKNAADPGLTEAELTDFLLLTGVDAKQLWNGQTGAHKTLTAPGEKQI